MLQNQDSSLGKAQSKWWPYLHAPRTSVHPALKAWTTVHIVNLYKLSSFYLELLCPYCEEKEKKQLLPLPSASSGRRQQNKRACFDRQPQWRKQQEVCFNFYFFILGFLRQGLTQPRPPSHSLFLLPSPPDCWDYRYTLSCLPLNQELKSIILS